MADIVGTWAVNGISSGSGLSPGFVPDYIVLSYQFQSPGRDLDSRFKFIQPNVGDNIGWARGGGAEDWAYWGGDNTGTGFESLYINFSTFKTRYPLVNELQVDCRCFWYGTPSYSPVVLKIVAYKGGTMVNNYYLWENYTAQRSRTFDTYNRVISLYTQSYLTNGERLALLRISISTGNMYVSEI